MADKLLPWERQPGESLRAYERFCQWRDEGSERTWRKTAEAAGVSIRSIRAQAARYDWAGRLAAWRAYQDARADDRVREEISRIRLDIMRSVRDAAATYAERMAMMDPDEIPATMATRGLKDLLDIMERLSG